MRVLDHPIEHLRHPRGVAHLLLIADHLLEQRHLRHLLEPALADGLVGRLGCHQQQRVWFQYAVLTGVTRLVIPGPFWPMHMAILPVARV